MTLTDPIGSSLRGTGTRSPAGGGRCRSGGRRSQRSPSSGGAPFFADRPSSLVGRRSLGDTAPTLAKSATHHPDLTEVPDNGTCTQQGWRGRVLYRSRTNRRPSSTCAMSRLGIIPTCFSSRFSSTVPSCVTLATESFDSPVLLRGRRTFPGFSASRVLLVRSTAITVRRRLALKASDWMMRMGRRNPGCEPGGAERAAHQISPRSATTLRDRCFPPAFGRTPDPDGPAPLRALRSVWR